MKSDLSDSFSELNKTSREYLKTQVEIIKLSFLEKVTKISAFLISSVVLLVFGMLIFLFAALAFVVWYERMYGDYLTGLLIVLGLVVIMAILFIIFRNSLVTSKVLRTISSILLESAEEDEE